MVTRSSLVLLLTAGLLVTSLGGPAQPAEAATIYSGSLRQAARLLPVAAEYNTGYDRDKYFGRWKDVNGDCQNTRAEVLIQETRVTPTFTSTSRCTVANGSWITTFDNRKHTSATTVQVDHTVPVHEAWGSGARYWTQARRAAFYNDLADRRSLNAQTSALNSAKQASGPEQWMPPNNQCTYIAQWVAVKIRWSLKVDSTERAKLVTMADKCPAMTITVTKV